ncbi:MAG: hypothetical protein ACKN9T_14215 [Candidatus Methylumidiphilus sp.]
MHTPSGWGRWLCAAILLSASAAAPAEPVILAHANPPKPEDVFALLGLDGPQIEALAQGKIVAYPLAESSADELANGIALYVPGPVADAIAYLRQGDPKAIDAEVSIYGVLPAAGGADAFARLSLPPEEAEALPDVAAGDDFNFSAEEIASFKPLKRLPKAAAAAEQHYRQILSQRLAAYRKAGLNGIARYARVDTLDSDPALELRQAANEKGIIAHFFPALRVAWLNYPAPLPPGMDETYLWVHKTVEGQPSAILRHTVMSDWHSGLLMLTREFYVEHSYNSSQWTTLCLPYLKGVVIFQQVRSYTDQVTGTGSDVKRLIGRELLERRMATAWERVRQAILAKAPAR